MTIETNAFLVAFILALSASAISLTLSKSTIFEPVRKKTRSKSERLGELISCTYCTSHWVCLVLFAIYRPTLVSVWIGIDLFVSLFAIVAISAVISGVITSLWRFSQPDISRDITENVEKLKKALEIAREKIIEQDKVIKELKK